MCNLWKNNWKGGNSVHILQIFVFPLISRLISTIAIHWHSGNCNASTRTAAWSNLGVFSVAPGTSLKLSETGTYSNTVSNASVV